MTPGRYKGNDEIGRLIHDFKCLNSEEAYNSALAACIKQYKETEGGRKEMSDIVERYGNKMEKRGMRMGEQMAMINSVKSLMDTMKLTLDQALDALKIQGKERESIIKAVQG